LCETLQEENMLPVYLESIVARFRSFSVL